MGLLFTTQWLAYRFLRRQVQGALPDRRWPSLVLLTLFLSFGAALIMVIVIRPKALEFPAWFRWTAMYPFFVWYASTVFLGLVYGLGIVVRVPFRLMASVVRKVDAARKMESRIRERSDFQGFNASRRKFVRGGIGAFSVATFVGNGYGVCVGKDDREITQQEIFIHKLDPEFDGFTIALVTDVHSSVFMTKKDMDEYVRLLNGMGTDAIVVAGDFVNGQTEEVYPFAEAFSGLRAPSGVFGVTGNHDGYVPDPEEVVRVVESAGIHLLHNEHRVLTRGNAHLRFLGIDDASNSSIALSRMDEAVGSNLISGPSILLCHRPYYLPQAAARKIDLVLSGHTHGGQVVFANIGRFAITPAALASPYVAGLYRQNRTQMYVSRGIGTVGVPVRLNCPPELTRIILRRSD